MSCEEKPLIYDEEWQEKRKENPHTSIKTTGVGVFYSSMYDIICIIFSRGKMPSDEILEMADEIGITVIASPMTTYTACGELYIHGLPGTKKKPEEV